MRRGRSAGAASSYRALAHHHHHQQQVPSNSTLIRSFDVDANPARPVRPSPLATSLIRDMPLDLVDRIRSFPLFQSAPGEFLIAIGNHLKPQIHAPNDHVVTEGDDAKAMYWLVRGVVAVTSRDGEAVYAELKPGAFFGEIGVLMNMPRTATIVARTKCLLLVLKKEDLQLVLPRFPDMEQAILEEAQERLNLLKKKRIERGAAAAQSSQSRWSTDDAAAATGGVSTGESGVILDGAVVKNSKKRKSPSPGIEDPASGGSVIGSGLVNIRKTLKELPLFSTLPPDILHFLGLSVAPKSFPPFTDIIRQGSTGNEIYFIVQGEAEVVHRDQPSGPQYDTAAVGSIQPRPRLKAGQYFGEVASLGLSAGRTATVRSITTVECLVVPGETLEELWRRCPPSIRSQVEETAWERYSEVRQTDGPWDVDMTDTSKADKLSDAPKTPPKTPSPDKVGGYVAASIFTTPSRTQLGPMAKDDHADMMGPRDPDPFRSVDMENLRNRRRQSLVAPATALPLAESAVVSTSGRPNGIARPRLLTDMTPSPSQTDFTPEASSAVRVKRARTLPSQRQAKAKTCHGEASAATAAAIAARSDDILVRVFKHLDVGNLVRLRIVSKRWRQILETSPLVCNDVDLSRYSRRVNDDVIVGVLGPFIGTRAVSVDLNGCFHITDKGFSALWSSCGKNVKRWRMRSVWDVSATQILEMSENAKSLEELDWSNCRKVGDNLLARVVGWVIPAKKANAQTPSIAASQPCDSKRRMKTRSRASNPPSESEGNGESKSGSDGSEAAGSPSTVIGCPRLSKLDLSYCKHVTDRSMTHLALHASSRLRWLSLTRCTSITDAGFQAWATHKFERLTHLCLADCTYLSDSAIVALVGAAKHLTHLDLSFCCALSDTSTEVVALGLPRLRELRLAFCGSAVSDGSLQSIALHLGQLEGLSVRGCVRVTGRGLENVLGGCARLGWVDVSQCRNLEAWLRSGSVAKWGFDDRAKKPPPQQQAAPCGRESQDEMSIPTPPQALSAATMLATPGFLPRPHLGGYFLGRRAKRQPVRFIIEKGVQGLR
ncbi:hypothetical protein XA68_16770 [Ophiocordyceps unilateralis]|uniref:Cyclic nucleotide-binding domain-containing protein n=1 Tax=Ophiocordyceps unilateralis TaxID=268505 RepID=A0A2A9P610_OPHUN|nr:hypothetical protein XA68_16770 [Ophiocordyceps unilateralis]